jgi:hypothetical protein
VRVSSLISLSSMRARFLASAADANGAPMLILVRQHTSAYVSIRQHTSAYVSIRQLTSAYVSIRQHADAIGAPMLIHHSQISI